jgi:hypothetical protein
MESGKYIGTEEYKMKKLIFATLINLLVTMIFSGCVSAVRYDGPYEGRVIDAETGQPIEGVVVLGTWYSVTVTPGGGTHNFYDAQETATDINGEFRIQGLGLRILSNVEPMDVLIFKAGYEYDSGSWRSFKEGSFSKEYKWEANKAIIPLKKLTIDERRRNIPPPPPGEAPYKKIKLMLDEYNKNHKELGLGIIDVWRDMR